MTKSYSIEDPLAYAREVVGRDPWAVFIGIEVEEAREGYGRCSLTVKPEHMNAVDRAHGAIIHAVADQAFAVACNSTGVMAIALSFNINYLSSAADGERIFAEAMPKHIGRKISVWNIEVRGNEDNLIATGVGTAYHK